MKNIIMWLVSFGSCILPLGAAAPATHVYFAQIWNEAIEEKDTQKFITVIGGTLFPDIRYSGTISRNDTHEKNISLDKIRKTKNPFKAGMRLHVYVDKKREAFVKISGINSLLKKIPSEVRVLFLKTLEDEILWDKVNIPQALQSMQVIYPEEMEHVDESVAVDWHHSMSVYLKQRPSEFFKQLSSQNKGFLKADPATVKEWSRIMPMYAKDHRFIDYTNKMAAFVAQKF